ncbi:hypothetical protein A6R68_16003, partial [Neotoma lepida]
MPNPIDEMTEEQKEYEAMKLVNMLDKLSRRADVKDLHQDDFESKTKPLHSSRRLE